MICQYQINYAQDVKIMTDKKETATNGNDGEEMQTFEKAMAKNTKQELKEACMYVLVPAIVAFIICLLFEGIKIVLTLLCAKYCH